MLNFSKKSVNLISGFGVSTLVMIAIMVPSFAMGDEDPQEAHETRVKARNLNATAQADRKDDSMELDQERTKGESAIGVSVHEDAFHISNFPQKLLLSIMMDEDLYTNNSGVSVSLINNRWREVCKSFKYCIDSYTHESIISLLSTKKMSLNYKGHFYPFTLDSSSNLSITKDEPFNSAEPFILKCKSNIFNGKVCVNGALARFSSAEEYELVEFPIFSYDLGWDDKGEVFERIVPETQSETVTSFPRLWVWYYDNQKGYVRKYGS